jgi:2-polyprenyl-6-hydroxyphenyl methylase/3-demethylubiquinone-9 3-methyltransferase
MPGTDKEMHARQSPRCISSGPGILVYRGPCSKRWSLSYPLRGALRKGSGALIYRQLRGLLMNDRLLGDNGPQIAESPSGSTPSGSTIDPADIARFSALAATWWDPLGPFKPLHKFNPARLAVIRAWITGHFGRESMDIAPFAGLSAVDIGCGGGLVAEPMARLGARVLGIDAGPKNIGTARAHQAALAEELDLSYRAISVEALADEGLQFDIVLTLEVVEHVADLGQFLKSAGRLVAPGGILIAATLNRTLKAFGLAIVGAEYVLGWLPRGTHDWSKFVTPQELEAELESAGLDPGIRAGFSFNPLTDRWRSSQDLSVNYMMAATKPR